MNRKTKNKGFTLIEILVAITMIALVFALVFGTSSAITGAVRAYNARRDLVSPVKSVIRQMARQIRCAYAPSPRQAETKIANLQSSTINNQSLMTKGFAYFSGPPSAGTDKTGSLLHLITTSGFSIGRCEQEGMYDVTYRFDSDTGTLFYSQRQFAPVGEDLNQNWSAEGRVAEGIDRITLKFFDGKTWQQSWDWYEQKQRLPAAVSIEITLKGERNYQYRYETVAFALSAENRSERIESKQLASAGK